MVIVVGDVRSSRYAAVSLWDCNEESSAVNGRLTKKRAWLEMYMVRLQHVLMRPGFNFHKLTLRRSRTPRFPSSCKRRERRSQHFSYGVAGLTASRKNTMVSADRRLVE